MTRNLRLGPTPGGGVGGEFGQMQRELNQQVRNKTGYPYIHMYGYILLSMHIYINTFNQQVRRSPRGL